MVAGGFKPALLARLQSLVYQWFIVVRAMYKMVECHMVANPSTCTSNRFILFP